MYHLNHSLNPAIKLTLTLFIALSSLICFQSQAAAKANVFGLVDPDATQQTRNLYKNLNKVRQTHFLFGHQDSLAYGYEWEGDLDRSDIRDVTGSNPAVYGWELGGLELGNTENLDKVNFEKMQSWIKAGYARGAVISISWHMNNPVSGGNAWTKTPTVHEILPGGSKHELFKQYLDTFVVFNSKLTSTDSKGKTHLIPIIFRPWHEHTGDWFWWGKGNASEEDYRALFRFTVEYFRDKKHLHNLIYAYSPDRSRIDLNNFDHDYLYGYPGDKYVDIIGFDNYFDVGSTYNKAPVEEQIKNFVSSIKSLVLLAEAKHKVPALTETGNQNQTIDKWWTERILNPLLKDPDAQRIAYLLVWRNPNKAREGKDEFFAPYAGHPSAADFIKFYQSDKVLFEKKLPPLYQ